MGKYEREFEVVGCACGGEERGEVMWCEGVGCMLECRSECASLRQHDMQEVESKGQDEGSMKWEVGVEAGCGRVFAYEIPALDHFGHHVRLHQVCQRCNSLHHAHVMEEEMAPLCLTELQRCP